MSRDPDCVFCKIVAGDLPSSVVYEDRAVLAFLDINPLADGHLILIPREHYGQLSDITPEAFSRIAFCMPILGRTLVEVAGADGFNVLQNNGQVAGQVVPHVHFHLIPRRTGDGLGYRWNAGTYPPGRSAELAAAYKKALALRSGQRS